MSLRARLALLTLVVVAAALVAIGVAVPSLVREKLTEEIDDRLETGRIATMAQYIDERREIPRNAETPEPRVTGPDAADLDVELTSLYVERRTADGQLIEGGYLLDSSSARQVPKLPEVLDRQPGETFTVGGTGDGPSTSFRVHVTESEGTDELVVGAMPTIEIDATIDRIVVVELVVSGIVLLVVVGAVWWLVGVGLAPLRRMEATAESITRSDFAAGDRGRRIPHPRRSTEIGRLGATLNEMLAEIDRAFDGQQASEAKLRRFVADASHELRTPLTSIRGYAELSRRRGERERMPAHVRRIEDEAVRMSRIVEDLLLLAHLDEGRPLQRQRVDLVAVATAVVDDARAANSTRQWTIETSRPAVFVDGDHDRLTQVVTNLVANARVHASPGAPVEVRVDLDGAATVDVIDHGPGLTANNKVRIFDRFYRVDAGRSRGEGGSGLGLSIAAGIVAAHGGSLSVVDTPGGGSTFTVSLPTD